MEVLDRNPYTPQWRRAARAYLRRAGCDPDDPQRREWFRQERARRRAAFDQAGASAGIGEGV
jgi:hypothetical protein